MWSLALGLLAQSAVFVGWRFAGQARAGAGSILFGGRARRRREPRPFGGPARIVARAAWIRAIRAPLPCLRPWRGRGLGPVSGMGMAEPMWATDRLAIWGLKGKLAFLAPALKQRLFLDPALAWSHPEYPLLVPLSLAALAGLGARGTTRPSPCSGRPASSRRCWRSPGFWVAASRARQGSGPRR